MIIDKTYVGECGSDDVELVITNTDVQGSTLPPPCDPLWVKIDDTYVSESRSDNVELVIADDLPEPEALARHVSELLQVLQGFLLLRVRLSYNTFKTMRNEVVRTSMNNSPHFKMHMCPRRKSPGTCLKTDKK